MTKIDLEEIDETSNYLHELLYKAHNSQEYDNIKTQEFLAMADNLRETLAEYFEFGEYSDPTPCCHQHGVGAIGSNEKCPDIADND